MWDLVVIGAGAVGSFTAWSAAERGARVLVLEQATPAHVRGSSHGRSRIFRHAYFEAPHYVPLLRWSTRRFEALEGESGESLLHRAGVLLLGRPGWTVVPSAVATAERWGVPVESLDAEGVRRRFPWFALPEGGVGLFEADAGLVRPERAVHAALERARAHGATVRTTLRVEALDEDASGVTVRTAEGGVRAARVAVAAGAWTARLLPELAPLLRVTRQVQAWVSPRQGVDATALPCWLYDRGPELPAVYGLAPDPREDARTRAPKVALHGQRAEVDPEEGAPPVDDADLRRLGDAYAEAAPALAGRVHEAATCLYTVTPDEHFLVDRGSRRVAYVAGLSGHGFKLAPSLGEALAELALEGRVELPVAFLSAARFAR